MIRGNLKGAANRYKQEILSMNYEPEIILLSSLSSDEDGMHLPTHRVRLEKKEPMHIKEILKTHPLRPQTFPLPLP